jgi:hypothetical protein
MIDYYVNKSLSFFLGQSINSIHAIRRESLSLVVALRYVIKLRFKVPVSFTSCTKQGFTIASILDPMPRFHVTLVDAKGKKK